MYNVISLLDQYQTYKYPYVEIPSGKKKFHHESRENT